jgi:hypothetical protein
MRPKKQSTCFGLPSVLVCFLLFILISSFLVVHRLVVVSQEIQQENLAQQQEQEQNSRPETENQYDVNSEEKVSSLLSKLLSQRLVFQDLMAEISSCCFFFFIWFRLFSQTELMFFLSGNFHSIFEKKEQRDLRIICCFCGKESHDFREKHQIT